MKLFKQSKRYAVVVFGSALASTSAMADVAADAVTELGVVKTGVETVGPALIGIVGVVALITIVLLMMKKS